MMNQDPKYNLVHGMTAYIGFLICAATVGACLVRLMNWFSGIVSKFGAVP